MKKSNQNTEKVQPLEGTHFPFYPSSFFKAYFGLASVSLKKLEVQMGLQNPGSKGKWNLGGFPYSRTVILTASFFGVIALHSCTTVKEYEKNKLNDAEMVLGNRTIEKTELNFQSYREGSSGANAGKVGGGCGCN